MWIFRLKKSLKSGRRPQTIYRWWDSRAVWYLFNSATGFAALPDCDATTPCLFGKFIIRFRQANQPHGVGKRRFVWPRRIAIRNYVSMAEAVYLPRIAAIGFEQAGPENFPRRGCGRVDALYGAVWYKVLIRFEKVSRPYIKNLVSQALASA